MINFNEFEIIFGVYALVGVYLAIVHHFICRSEGGSVWDSALVVPQTSKRAHFNAVPDAENPAQP